MQQSRNRHTGTIKIELSVCLLVCPVSVIHGLMGVVRPRIHSIWNHYRQGNVLSMSIGSYPFLCSKDAKKMVLWPENPWRTHLKLGMHTQLNSESNMG